MRARRGQNVPGAGVFSSAPSGATRAAGSRVIAGARVRAIHPTACKIGVRDGANASATVAQTATVTLAIATARGMVRAGLIDDIVSAQARQRLARSSSC